MKKRRFIIWVMIGILGMLRLSSPFFLHAEDRIFDLSSSEFPPHVRNELIIQFAPGIKIDPSKNHNATILTGIAQLDSLNSICNAKEIVPLIAPQANIDAKAFPTRLAHCYVLKFAKATDVTKFIPVYKKLPFIETAEVNQVYYSHGSKTKQAVTIDQSQLAEAASLIEHKNQVIIGIIDTGIDWQKKRLLSNLWKNPRELLDGLDNDANGFVDDIWGWNFVDPEMMQESGLQWKNKPEDNCGHGSIIADICNQISNYQSGKNNSKMNRLMILKSGFATADGTIIFTTISTARSIIYAANHGANIINISWGSAFPSMILQQAIKYAIDKGCLIIASAGNDNSQRLNYPAAFDNVSAVAAIDSTNKKLSASNYGYWIDVAAPGAMRTSDTLATCVSGTSLAAAYVSGLAGLAAGCGRNFNADSLRAKIIWSSDNIYQNNPAFVGQLGAGKINLKRALLSEFRPNVIIQNCISLNRNQTFLPGEIIPLVVHVKNLSYPAKNVQITLATDDPIAEIISSQLTIPALDYRQKYSNESEPFKFSVKQAITNECKIQFKAYITAAYGFSSFQEFTVAIGKSPPKNLTLINDSPVTLYWSGEQKFVSYHVYRRRDDQQSFARVTETPALAANFIDNTADAGRYYHYFVTGIDQSNHETPASNIISLEVAAGLRFVSSSTNDATQSIKIKSAFPCSDTILFKGDTLQFRCIVETKHVGALKYSWILNEKLLNQANDSIFILVADSLPHPKNSLTVAISDTDAVISHSWKIEIAKQQPKFLFFPASDTTIAEGDTLKIRFETGKHNRPTRAVQWLLNGVYDNLAVGNYYRLTPDFNSAGIDTITLKYQSADTSFSRQWLVTILDRNRPPRILSFSPAQDTTITRNDTLKLSVKASDENSDSLSFRWFVNGQIDTTEFNVFYHIAKKNQHTKTDTIIVAVADQDSSIRHTWLIQYLKRKNSIPRIISCQPSIDSTLSKADSIHFQISCDDPDGDSLTFVWHLNSLVDSTAFDSTYFYQPNRPSRYDDTLGVAISDADTTIKIVWILRAAFGRKADSFAATPYWFPEQDSIIAAGDSIVFSANFPEDSCRFQWSINSAVDSARSDSVFIYHLSRHTSMIDTIRVLVVAPDTVVSHQWLLFHSNPGQTSSALAVAFHPMSEIIECNSQDSLKFSVQVVDGKFETMRFFWFINETPDTTFQDTTFLYQPGLLSKNSDTITIKIVYNDSTFTHQWIIKKNQVSILPAPKLLFPIKGDHVTEEELFIWQNDSSLARIDSLRSCRFIIQIAKDTTFKQIVSMDTCKTSSIALKNLSGFNQISMAKPYYWRAKLITKNNSMSDFKKCEAPFYYHPLFAKVENFYGQKNEEGFIDLFWVTSYEKNCAGFNLYRSESENENFAKLNDQLITGKANFAYQDRTIDAGITYYYKLEDICLNGRKKFLQTITVTAPQPEKYCLYQNFPNPFNSMTYFKYEIPIATRVRIEVFNVLGRKLKTLVDEDKEAGFYTVYWDGIDDQGRSVVSGIYFYHMSTTKFNMTHKMIVVR